MGSEVEKPTEVLVGQRYKFCGDIYRVTDVDGKRRVRIVWERRGGPEVPQTGWVTIDGDWVYLGGPPSPSGEPVAWAVGQRRRVKIMDVAGAEHIGILTPIANDPWYRGRTNKYDFVLTCEPVGVVVGVNSSWPSELLPDAPPLPTPLAAPRIPPQPATDGYVITGIDWGEGIPVRREVSHNGRDWTDYDRLTDADAFEAYKHRRSNGIALSAVVLEPSVKVVGKYGPLPRSDESGKPRPDAGEFHRAKKPAPWKPSVDETDLLADA